jgi:hypothetical protein
MRKFKRKRSLEPLPPSDPLLPSSIHRLFNVPEIINSMLEYLDNPSLLKVLTLHRELTPACARLLWRHLKFINFHGYLGMIEIVQVLYSSTARFPYGQYVRSIEIQYSNHQKGVMPDITLDHALLRLVQKTPWVNQFQIQIQDPTKLSLFNLFRSFLDLPHITDLNLNWTPKLNLNQFLMTEWMHDHAFSFTHLTSLKIIGSCLSDQGFQSLLTLAPNLIALGIHETDSISSSGIAHLLQSHRHTLQRLHIRRCPKLLDRPLMEFASQCAPAKASPGKPPSLKISVPVEFARASILSELTLDTAETGLTEDGLEALFKIISGPMQSNALRKVSLTGCNAEGIERIAPMCQNVVSLEIIHCSDLDKIACEALARSLKSLRQLRLRYCLTLDDICLRNLAGINDDQLNVGGCLNNVEELDIQCANRISDAGIRFACDAIRQLHWVRLVGK